MNDVETPLGILGAEAERVDAEGLWDQRGDVVLQNGAEAGCLRLGQFARQSVVAAELVHYIGIAPLQQQRVLFGRETGGAAAGEVGVGEGARNGSSVRTVSAARRLSGLVFPVGTKARKRPSCASSSPSSVRGAARSQCVVKAVRRSVSVQPSARWKGGLIVA